MVTFKKYSIKVYIIGVVIQPPPCLPQRSFEHLRGHGGYNNIG
jgi:hypothetical protein